MVLIVWWVLGFQGEGGTEAIIGHGYHCSKDQTGDTQRDKRTERKMDRQTDDRWTDRQTERQTNRLRQINRQTDIHTQAANLYATMKGECSDFVLYTKNAPSR